MTIRENPETTSSGRGGRRDPPGGRPRKIRGRLTQVNVQLNQTQLAKLDRIIRQVERVSSRPDAVRWLLEDA